MLRSTNGYTDKWLCNYYLWHQEGCSGAGTHGDGVPTPFSCEMKVSTSLNAALKWVWTCLQLASFLGSFPHLFVSTTSLGNKQCTSAQLMFFLISVNIGCYDSQTLSNIERSYFFQFSQFRKNAHFAPISGCELKSILNLREVCHSLEMLEMKTKGKLFTNTADLSRHLCRNSGLNIFWCDQLTNST